MSTATELEALGVFSEGFGRTDVADATTSGLAGVLSRFGANAWRPIGSSRNEVVFEVDGETVQIAGVQPPLPAWVYPTVETVVYLLRLGDNWDSYGAPKIDRSTAQYGIALLFNLLEDQCPAPVTVPTASVSLPLTDRCRQVAVRRRPVFSLSSQSVTPQTCTDSSPTGRIQQHGMFGSRAFGRLSAIEWRVLLNKSSYPMSCNDY
jgi:hypothetical protein